MQSTAIWHGTSGKKRDSATFHMILPSCSVTMLLMFFFSFPMVMAATPVEISINPSLSEFDSSFTATLPQKKFFLQLVTDTSSSRDQSGIVGETRIRRKTMIPIRSLPIPRETVKNSLMSFLKFKDILAESIDSADYIITVVVQSFTLKETSKKLTQTIDATITLEVAITTPGGEAQPKRFSISTQNSYTTIDTSKHTQKVMSGALKDAIREISKNLTNL